MSLDTEKRIAISADSVHPSPRNRTGTRDLNIEGLAASISSVGLLQPLVLRPHPSIKDEYEIVCGHRRWLACKQLNRPVEALVKDLTDSEAAEARSIENLQREGLSPLEESAEVQQLIDLGMDVRSIADRLGKPKQWVAQRVKIQCLSEKWQRAIRGNLAGVANWTGAHLAIIAAFDDKIQNEIFDNIVRPSWEDNNIGGMTIRDIEESVGEYVLDLRSAPWKLDADHVCVGIGPCSACPKQTGATIDLNLFGDADTKKKHTNERCLDKACWVRKQAAFIEEKATKLKVQNEDLLLIKGGYGGVKALPKNHDLNTAAIDLYKVQECKKTDTGARQALVVDGPGVGHIKWVRSFDSDKPIKKENSSKSFADRRAALETRRQARFAKIVEDLIDKENDNPSAITKNMCENISSILRAVAIFGADSVESAATAWDDWKSYDMLAKQDDKTALVKICRAVYAKWSRHIHQMVLDKETIEASKYARRVCEWLGQDAEGMYRQVVEEIKEPKSWAALKVAERVKKGVSGKKEKKAIDLPKGRRCRVCGCTDDDCLRCIEKTGEPCHWVEDDLCSACAEDGVPARSVGKLAKNKKGK